MIADRKISVTSEVVAAVRKVVVQGLRLVATLTDPQDRKAADRIQEDLRQAAPEIIRGLRLNQKTKRAGGQNKLNNSRFN